MKRKNNKLEIVATILFLLAVTLEISFHYFFGIDLQPLGVFFFVITSAIWTIEGERKKKTPNKKLIYFISILSALVLIFGSYAYLT